VLVAVLSGVAVGVPSREQPWSRAQFVVVALILNLQRFDGDVGPDARYSAAATPSPGAVGRRPLPNA
jgi:hypothetical protein